MATASTSPSSSHSRLVIIFISERAVNNMCVLHLNSASLKCSLSLKMSLWINSIDSIHFLSGCERYTLVTFFFKASLSIYKVKAPFNTTSKNSNSIKQEEIERGTSLVSHRQKEIKAITSL